MKISHDYPPNIEAIRKVFDIKDRNDIVFTYGDTIHNPSKGKLTDSLIAHELVHTGQQALEPDKWWEKYLEDPAFRLSQEVEAYQEQYRFFISRYKDRNRRAVFLYKIASDLSGKMYGNMIEYRKAVELITKGGEIK